MADPNSGPGGFQIPEGAIPKTVGKASEATTKNNWAKDITSILNTAGVGADVINAVIGRGQQAGLIDDFEDKIFDAIDNLEDKSADLRGSFPGSIGGINDAIDTAFGKTTKDAVAEYKQRFDDVYSDMFNRGYNRLDNFSPNLDPYTAKLSNTIQQGRQDFGLLNSPAMDAYKRVIDVDQTKVFPDAIDFSAATGYNQANPLITYMDDPDSVAMMNFGDRQLAAYTDAMVNPNAAGQKLMQYGV